MTYTLYDYVNAAGTNEFREWSEGLEKAQLAKLNEKLDKLEQNGMALIPHALAATAVNGIQKLKVKGNVQLRPMLTRGPVDNGAEFTLLFGAKEVGGKLQPPDAANIANDKKTCVIGDPSRRRTPHVRVTGAKR